MLCRASLYCPAAMLNKRLGSRHCAAGRRKQWSVFRSCRAAGTRFDLPSRAIITSLATVLRIRRTLTGEEIDNVIAHHHARLVLAAERERRHDWSGVLGTPKPSMK